MAKTTARSWIAGGVLLVASAVLNAVAYPTPRGLAVSSALAAAAAFAVFAIGRSATDSVTARRPLWTGALLVLAAWMLVRTGVSFVPAQTGTEWWLPVWGYANLLVPTAAAVVAVVGIARARVVPGNWRWAPTWALAASAIPSLSTWAIVAADPARVQQNAAVIGGLNTAVGLVVPLFLGILAIVLGARPRRPASLTVYAP